MSMKVWRLIDKTDTNLFLYHYTTMEKVIIFFVPMNYGFRI